ncbi:MAG TPA: DUF6600 domain-containing protein [Chthoniobacteraceae bacterium]|jgi:hypothetical protein
MKTPHVLTLLFSAAGLLGSLAPRAEAEVSFSFFYDSLSPHGEWIEVGDYGNCWRPTGVDSNWSPYSDGYWTYTDAGWTWVSYEDFGGITYHYGRWVQVEDEGWCWTPGYEWGPAWVSWRNSDEHIGWAPLPPEASFRREVGLSVWVDTSYDIAPSYYNFCETRHFGAPLLRPVIIDRSQNVTIIENTVNITNITYNNYSKVVYNGGPNYAAINRRSDRSIPSLKLVRNTNIDGINGRNGRGGGKDRRGLPRSVQRGNQLEVFAPDVVRNDRDADSIRPKRKVPGEKVRRGLAEVKDEGVRNRLRDKLRKESNGLTAETAPARPVQASDLQGVPQKADPNAPSQAGTGKNRRDRQGREDRPAGDNTADRGKANKNRKPSDIIAAPEPVTPPTDGQTAATPERGNASEEGKQNRRERREAAADAQEQNAGERNENKVARQAEKQRRDAAEQGAGDGDGKRRQDRNANAAEQSNEGQSDQRAEKLRQRQAEATRQQAAADQTRREMNADRAANEARRQQQQAARAAEENTSRQTERAEQRREQQQRAATRDAGDERAAQMARQRAAQQAQGQAAERRQQQMQQQRAQGQQERAFEAQRQRAMESRQQRAQEMQQQRASQMQQQRASQMQEQRAAQMQQRSAQAQQQRAAQMQQQQQIRRQQAAPQGGGGGGGGGKRKKDKNEE